MYFRQITARHDGTLTYVLADLGAGQAVVIDPTPADGALIRALLAERDIGLRWILCSHSHDGAADGASLARLCAQALGSGVLAGSDIPANVRHVGDGDAVVFGDQVVHVLATPGHTTGSLCFLWCDRLFCGDTLELRGCGPLDAPAANAGQLYDSVTQTLFALPGETLIFPGHEHRGRTVSTIAEERTHHPLYSRLSRDEFVAACVPGRVAAPRVAAAVRRPRAGLPHASGSRAGG